MISLLSERTHTQNILESRFYLASMQKRMIDNEIGQVTLKTAILQLETVQYLQIAGMKWNVLFLQRMSMRKPINGSMQHVTRSGEKGGMTTRSCHYWL